MCRDVPILYTKCNVQLWVGVLTNERKIFTTSTDKAKGLHCVMNLNFKCARFYTQCLKQECA